MKDEKKDCDCGKEWKKRCRGRGSGINGGTLYEIGVVGALAYFL